jgi:hypothetical protein
MRKQRYAKVRQKKKKWSCCSVDLFFSWCLQAKIIFRADLVYVRLTLTILFKPPKMFLIFLR